MRRIARRGRRGYTTAGASIFDEDDGLQDFRDSVRRFVATEIAPHASAWDEAGEFPRDLYAKAARAGILGVGFQSEAYGGFGGSIRGIALPAMILHGTFLQRSAALAQRY